MSAQQDFIQILKLNKKRNKAMYNGAYTDFNLVYQKPMGT